MVQGARTRRKISRVLIWDFVVGSPDHEGTGFCTQGSSRQRNRVPVRVARDGRYQITDSVSAATRSASSLYGYSLTHIASSKRSRSPCTSQSVTSLRHAAIGSSSLSISYTPIRPNVHIGKHTGARIGSR